MLGVCRLFEATKKRKPVLQYSGRSSKREGLQAYIHAFCEPYTQRSTDLIVRDVENMPRWSPQLFSVLRDLQCKTNAICRDGASWVPCWSPDSFNEVLLDNSLKTITFSCGVVRYGLGGVCLGPKRKYEILALHERFHKHCLPFGILLDLTTKYSSAKLPEILVLAYLLYSRRMA